MQIGTDLRRDRVLHFGTQVALGGPIRPKKAKALTIPLTAAARRKRPRDVAGLFLLPAGPEDEHVGVLAVRRGKTAKSRLDVMWVLRTAVTIAARPFLEILPKDVKDLIGITERHIDGEAFKNG